MHAPAHSAEMLTQVAFGQAQHGIALTSCSCDRHISIMLSLKSGCKPLKTLAASSLDWIVQQSAVTKGSLVNAFGDQRSPPDRCDAEVPGQSLDLNVPLGSRRGRELIEPMP